MAAVEGYTAVSVEAAARHHALVITRLQQRDSAMLKTLPSAARRLVQAGLFDRRAVKALERERRAAAQIVEDADERADVSASSLRLERIVRLAAVRVGCRMIPGLSGTILSHDALRAGGLTLPAGDGSAHVQRAAAEVACRSESHCRSGMDGAESFRRGDGAAVQRPWFSRRPRSVEPISRPRRAPVGRRSGRRGGNVRLGTGSRIRVARKRAGAGSGPRVRWCFCFNGPALRLFDATRTHSRRYVELDLTHLATDPATFAVAWRLLRAEAFVPNGQAGLDAAVMVSERHRSDVRDCLQSGVQEALSRLTSAFVAAARKSRRRRGASLPASDAYEESLIVIYRILFLLFAEARGLVPNWHPIFRDSYTVEALRPVAERRSRPPGTVGSAAGDRAAGASRLPGGDAPRAAVQRPPFLSLARAARRLAPARRHSCARCAPRVLRRGTGRDGRRRIAYADLGVEHLGGVYERVLDFEINTAETDAAAVLVRSGRRKSTGTFYTPRTLTEYLVRRTLAPLVGDAGPDDILRLRIARSRDGQRRVPGRGVPLPGACLRERARSRKA